MTKLSIADNEIVRVYKETRSAPKTAEKLGIGLATVYQRLELHDVSRSAGQLDAQILRLYGQMKSPTKIAKKLGIGTSTVYRRLEFHAVLREGQPGMPRKLPKTVGDDYLAGASMNQIAVRYGTSTATVLEALRRAGIESRRRGGIWKGGLTHTPEGYIMAAVFDDDPMAVMRSKSKGTARYVLQHRLVMARHIGRPLERHETVHHINGNRADNRLENLQLRTGHHGTGVVHRCRACGSTDIESTRLQ